MRAVILSLDTGAYKAKADVAAAASLKRMLEQVGIEVRAADRLLPGIPEALRAYNLRHTKKVILDRSEAGIRKKTLMINLPESAKMAKEDLEYILPEVVQVIDTFSLR